MAVTMFITRVAFVLLSLQVSGILMAACTANTDCTTTKCFPTETLNCVNKVCTCDPKTPTTTTTVAPTMTTTAAAPNTLGAILPVILILSILPMLFSMFGLTGLTGLTGAF